MKGVELNAYQRALALDEYYKLLDYVDELEQLTIPVVVGQSEQLKAFAGWRNKKDDSIPWITAMEIEEYLKSL